ncbi:PREDICTED: beta-1,3-galactosyltransferase 1-like [Branchiostoma belcheri]|uniref:Hexosyltransferase n=1 Tax=Branchiostoma belcheri TaxID=7741 RepID=A0A6P5A4G0_BRABE|nr:PREDICTED: beta-1,3-galactosyltransferase 1-like [Branchiostoma belcheri]
MGLRLKLGNLRSGLNAALLFGLMLACLHLYTLRERMHRLERKMTLVRGGSDVIRDKPDVIRDKRDVIRDKRDVIGHGRDVIRGRRDVIRDGSDVIRGRHDVVIDGSDVIRDGRDVVRRSLAAKKEQESVQDLSDQVERSNEEHSVDSSLRKAQNLEEKDSVDLSKPQDLQEERSVDLNKPQDLDSNISSAKIDSEAKNTTLAPKPASTSAATAAVTLSPPLHATSAPPDPVINPHNFNFILNNPDKCGDGDVLLLILVTTTVRGQVERETIRRTWGNESNIPGVVFKTVFAVGLTDDQEAQAALVEENNKFKDIIQEDFVDSYHNLTLKTVMCWKWAFQYCPKARFIMKADDDTFVNIFSVTRHLIGLLKSRVTRYVTGWVYVDTKPIRDPMSQWNKWYVKYEDYPRDSYPNYPCGFAYVISNDVTKTLYETAETIKYLFLEDAFLGLCMEKLGIEPVHQGGFIPWYTHIDSCQFDWLMASHWVKRYEYMWYLWNTLTSC